MVCVKQARIMTSNNTDCLGGRNIYGIRSEHNQAMSWQNHCRI